MAINGISTSNLTRPSSFPIRDNVRDSGRTPAQQPAQTSVPASTPAAATPSAKTNGQAVPAEPPSGTDPALWSILSGEERAFFAKAGAMGPLTYGRAFQAAKTAQLPANRGGRLDVKI